MERRLKKPKTRLRMLGRVTTVSFAVMYLPFCLVFVIISHHSIYWLIRAP